MIMQLKVFINKIYGFPIIAKKFIKTATARVNPRPILIFGNQKAGTSAIAALLAELTNLSVAIDLQQEIENPTYPLVYEGILPVTKFIKRNKLAFSRDIVKEPNLTLIYPALIDYFSMSKCVFIIRDPRDNIRSILNRLCLPGHLAHLEPVHWNVLTPAWQRIVDVRWLGLQGETYIELLAERWNFMTDVYLHNKDHLILVQYEKFLQDKIGELTRLASGLGLPRVNDITGSIDRQFQPRGNRDIDWLEFFGEDNLARIERCCGSRMNQLRYQRTVSDAI